MDIDFSRFSAAYQRLRRMSDAVFGMISSVLYSVFYIFLVPFVVILANKKIAAQATSGWLPWRLRSDTSEDVTTQY